MFTQDDKLKIVDAIINLVVISKEHPYTVLRQMVRSYDLPDLQAENLVADCKLILKGQAETLPFAFH
jgi:hypothetical protein